MNQLYPVEEYQEIIEAARLVSDAAWNFALVLKETLGPMYLPVIGTAQEEWAKAEARTPEGNLSGNRKAMKEAGEIKAIIAALTEQGFEYDHQTIVSLVTLATETPEDKRSEVNFWFQVSEVTHERERLNSFRCNLVNAEYDRLHKKRRQEEGRTRSRSCLPKPIVAREPEKPSVSVTLARINAVLAECESPELDELRKIVNLLIAKHLPKF